MNDISVMDQMDIVERREPAAEILGNGGAMTRMQTTYATAIAVQKPRRLSDVQRRLLEEADLAGEEFYYGWGAGKDRIEGASVKLALAAARCWGNCAVELQPVQETPDAWIFTAAFVDLETGFTLSRQFRQSKKWQVYGKHDEARKEDIRFQIGQSKAIRNVVLNAVSASLTTKAREQAKAGVRQKIEQYVTKNGMPAAIDMVCRALLKHGVSEERILAKMQVAAKTALDIDHLVILRGDLAAIDNGQ